MLPGSNLSQDIIDHREWQVLLLGPANPQMVELLIVIEVGADENPR
ncbi:hypothetical protein [Comamonas terrigena]|nr:hypothetical protein [Comamonas terrigena]MDH0049574.1 hypothetical protein [Comamonas terrigena]MDH0512149.1 hypothetical protein [Comamonas terrigena]MDH1091676.1 hypothetical protein [Comamonas terrigena]